ncbi:hypothetical protein BofuT4_P090760.1 [Botrytis cinerea T4]|uniref:Tat pathway signal sequence protein n=1 Tax=Botryotinia fuckeliana (strain T4) TaxID=999810 RepID=G2YEZ6_BOTF4|nr:hypothetical protein BofuT4_P090760.1 [Botrytis cinerea T4]
MPRGPAGYEEIRPGKKGFATYSDGHENDTHMPINREGETSRIPLRNRGWVQILVLAFLSLVFLGMGIAVGGRVPREERKWGLLAPPGSMKETWYPNTTFSMEPTPESEAAWGSLMPVGRGFIYRPEIAPIHGLRTSYYDLHYQIARAAGAPTDPFLEQKAAHTHIETAHQKHCFDYLRRAIMCAADTNLEYVDPVTDDTTGWGSERVCRSFADVKRWAEKWANGTGGGIA